MVAQHLETLGRMVGDNLLPCSLVPHFVAGADQHEWVLLPSVLDVLRRLPYLGSTFLSDFRLGVALIVLHD